jgi:hypothetical protein
MGSSMTIHGAGCTYSHFALQHDIQVFFVMYNARHPRADNVSKKYGAGSL